MSTPPDKTPPQPPTGVSVRTRSVEQFAGPLPHPDILAKYNTIVPGAAERILAMAEGDSKHMQTMEQNTLAGVLALQARGQHYGLTIGITALGVSALALFLGHENAAMLLGGTTVIGLVSVFVIGRLRGQSNGQPTQP